jgi:hypothetical protein
LRFVRAFESENPSATARHHGHQTPSQRCKKRKYEHHHRKPFNPKPKPLKKAKDEPELLPVNALKSNIRSLKRQLERNDHLSAVVQQEKERALKAATDELARNQRANRTAEMVKKWKDVRAEQKREAKTLCDKIQVWSGQFDRAMGEDGLVFGAREKKIVLEAEVDLAYAEFFPLDREYVPLVPRSEIVKKRSKDAEREVLPNGDAEMWERVRKCKAEGTLEELRDGKLDAAGAASTKLATSPTVQLPSKGKSREMATEGEDGEENDQDGGSFWE